MSDLSRVVSGFQSVGEEVWDPVHQKLLFTADGALKSLDPVSGQLTSVAIPGLRAAGLDVSPDGAFVLLGGGPQSSIADAGGSQTGLSNTYYRVAVATGQVETLSYVTQGNEGFVADVAVANNGNALLAPNIQGTVRTIVGGAPSPVPSDLTSGQEPLLFVSDDHRYVLIANSGLSSGRLEMYDASAPSALASSFEDHMPGHETAPDFIAFAAVSDTGLVAFDDGNGSLIITGSSFNAIRDLSFSLSFKPQGLAFSHDSKQLYVLERGKAEVAVFDTGSWNQLGVIGTQTTTSSDPLARGGPQNGALSLSQDGHFLFIQEANSIEVVDLAAHPIGGSGSGPVVPDAVIIQPLQVGAGQTVAHTDTSFFLRNGSLANQTILEIAGTVTASAVTSPALYGVQADEAGLNQLFKIDATGALRVSSAVPGGVAEGYHALALFDPSFENRGLLAVSSAGAATGVNAGAASGGYSNFGTVQVTGLHATGFLFSDDGAMTFSNAGSITVQDPGGLTGSSVGVDISVHGTSFMNTAGGSIVAAHTAPGTTPDIAVEIEVEGDFGRSYINAGLIQSDVALNYFNTPGFGSITPTIFTNQATGVLRGAVTFSGDGNDLKNAGLIDGPVNLGSGSEIYDGSGGGTVTGMVSGGAGDDRLIGGPGFDNFQGNTGNDTENGGAGSDVVVGGKDNDSQTGDADGDVVWGNLGNDTLDGGGGNDQVRGGQGDDSVSGGAGNDFISGDRGADTETGGGGADNFHGSQDAGIDRVLDFNQAEGDRVQLDPGTTYALSQVGADTVIDMGNGNQMILVGAQFSTFKDGWIFEG